MIDLELARLQAVEDAAAALLARKGPITRAALAAALATPAPAEPNTGDEYADTDFAPTDFG